MSKRIVMAVVVIIAVTSVASVVNHGLNNDEKDDLDVVAIGDTWPLERSSQEREAVDGEKLFLVIHSSRAEISCGLPTYPLRHYLYEKENVPFSLVLVGAGTKRGRAFLKRERLRPGEASIVELGVIEARNMGLGGGVFMEREGKVVGAWRVGEAPTGRLTVMDNYR